MRTHGGNFIAYSLNETASFLKNVVFAEDTAFRKGFLQARAARTKVFCAAIILLSILLAKNISFLFLVYLACLIAAGFSNINIIFFLKRTWVFVPIFSLLIVIPALFSVLSPGEPVLTFKLFGMPLIITRQGISGAAIFFMRVLASVSWVVLTVLTTRRFLLLKALRSFGVPQIFVMTISISYRYIYLLIEVFQDTYIAIKSRAGFVTSSRRGRKIAAWSIANLWQRSYKLHKDVYSAMLSRGFDGEPRTLDKNGKNI